MKYSKIFPFLRLKVSVFVFKKVSKSSSNNSSTNCLNVLSIPEKTTDKDIFNFDLKKPKDGLFYPPTVLAIIINFNKKNYTCICIFFLKNFLYLHISEKNFLFIKKKIQSFI